VAPHHPQLLIRYALTDFEVELDVEPIGDRLEHAHTSVPLQENGQLGWTGDLQMSAVLPEALDLLHDRYPSKREDEFVEHLDQGSVLVSAHGAGPLLKNPSPRFARQAEEFIRQSDRSSTVVDISEQTRHRQLECLAVAEQTKMRGRQCGHGSLPHIQEERDEA
jgi:hypothetical protein